MITALLLALAPLVAAADTAPCATPRAAASTILGNLNGAKPDVQRALRCIELPPKMKQAQLLAQMAKLKATLDSKGIVVKPKDIPDDANWLDEKTFRAEFVLTPSVPQLRLEKNDAGDWVLPRDVIADADAIYDDAAGFDVEAQAKKLSPELSKKVLGLFLWQWLGLIVVVLAAVVVRFVFAGVLLRKLSSFFRALGFHHEPTELRATARPVGWMVGCALVALLVPTLSLPATLTAFCTVAAEFVAALCVVWLCFRLVDVVAFHFAHRASHSSSRMDDHLVPLLRRISKLVVVVIGVVAGLQVVGVDVGSLVAGLGIGGLAVALAAKDTIGNFFGSIAIFLDRPFQIGDWVTYGNGAVEGTVEGIGFRSTQIRTIRDTVITVPNAKLADAEVDNWGARRHKRLRFLIAFPLDSSAEQLKGFVDGLRAALLMRPTVRKDVEVHLHDLVDGTLQVLAHFYVEEATWSGELTLRAGFMNDVVVLAASSGLKLATPVRTLHVENFPKVTTTTEHQPEKAEKTAP